MIRAKASSLTAWGSIIFPLAVLDRVRPSIRTIRFSLLHWPSFAKCSLRTNRNFVLSILAISVAMVFLANPNTLLLANDQTPLEGRALGLELVRGARGHEARRGGHQERVGNAL